MTRWTPRPSRLVAFATTAVALAALAVATAPTAGAAVPAVVPSTAASVTADALPTAQINGVAWTQEVVGTTVFVGGEFTKARPAGTAVGSSAEVTRTNLLSYDLRTGALTSWAPQVDGAVRDIAVSPDGKTLFVAGAFSTFDGQPRYRLAALDLATRKLVPNFAPAFDYTVNSIVVTARVVYAAGAFNRVGDVTRSKLAAVNIARGTLTAWDPGADGDVNALLMAPGGSTTLVVGGAFSQLGGGTSTGGPTTARGLGAVRTGNAAVVSWAANERVQDYGTNSAILSLSTDGRQVYATGYVYGAPGNLEGTVATDNKGNIVWVEDCHGDTYGSYPVGGLVYVVGHSHDCSTVGGFPDTTPQTHYPALAFTRDVRGTLGTNTVTGYANWGGTPAPALTGWFPTMAAGSYTGQTQAAWTITGSGDYVVVGGEFPSVNGTPQQGLVRFAKPSTAPNAVGPRYGGSQVPLTFAVDGRTVTVSSPANTDQDDMRLTYTIVRDDVTVGTVNAVSAPWLRPTVSFRDTSVPAGRHVYQVRATDADGNRAWSDKQAVTVP